MKKSILFLAGAAILLAGCAKVADENKEAVPENGERHITLKATVNEPDTRVSVNESGVYSWQQGDEIAISLSNEGEIMLSTATSAGATTNFSITLADGDELGQYAFYPASYDHGVYKDGQDIAFALANEYDYVKGATNMPMLGTISGDNISFKAVGGVLQLTVNNVPKNAYYFRVDANLPINGRYIVSENGDINVDEVEWNDDSYSVIFNLFKESGNGEVVRSWESAMTFYIPLPVGTYDYLGFSFLGAPDPDYYNYLPFLSSKQAYMGGNGLEVNRNDIIIAPNLNFNVLSFDDETKERFPELASDNQEDWIIRIPDNYDDSFYLSFETDYSWDVSFSFPEGEDRWVYFYTPKSTYTSGYEFIESTLYTEDAILHTAMMNFTCLGDPDLSFSIPVQEYRPLGLFDENGNSITNKYINLNLEDTMVITAAEGEGTYTDPVWSCLDGWTGNPSNHLTITPDPTNPFKATISSNVPTGVCIVVFQCKDSEGEEVRLGCFIGLGPTSLSLKVGDDDVTFGQLDLAYGGTPIELNAVISDVPKGFRVSNIRWYCDEDWQEDPVSGDWILIPHSGNTLSYTPSESNPPYSVSVTAGNEDAIGSYDWIDCRFTIENVTTGETFESDEYYCIINVTGNSSSQKAPSAKRSARKPRVFPK